MNNQGRKNLILRLGQLRRIIGTGHLTKKDRVRIAYIIMVMPLPVFKFIVQYIHNKKGKK